MKQIEIEIYINASCKTVWSILTDFERYAEWNPFIQKVNGKAQAGAKLDILIVPPGKKGVRFQPTVKSADENKVLSWLGHTLLPGIFNGQHSFILTENNNGCLLVQKEVFSGLLAPLLFFLIKNSTEDGFKQMNAALKHRAEQIQGSASC